MDDLSKRLQMMFAGDEALLKLDTRLTTEEELMCDDPWGLNPTQPTQETPKTTVPTVKPKPTPQIKADVTPRRYSKIPEWELRNAFCPAKALPKFPFKYILPKGGDLSKQVARGFFDGGRIWNRVWDLYYLPIPYHISEQPLLLIPAPQVKQFLDEINYVLNCDLALYKRSQEGLVLFFNTNDGTPKPVLLGQIEDRDSLDLVERGMPEPKNGDDDWTNSCEPAALEAFEKKVQAGRMAYKKKKPKPKSRPPTAEMIQWRMIKQPPGRGLYQLMSYLGLRPPLYEDNWLTVDEVYEPVNVLEPVCWEAQDNPVFYSVDVEWNERNSTQLTEIGISWLDTIDIRGIPPGPHGENWVEHIKSAHLRTAEYKYFCNTEFVKGCPDMFLFGESELIPNEQMGRRADWFFISPYDGTEDVTRQDLPEHKQGPRNIVLVGHNPDADVKLLGERCTVFDSVETRPGKLIRSLFDTQALYQWLRKEKNQSKLEIMLFGLGLEPKCLHNAGNDARYTLEALIRMAMESAGKQSEDSDEEVKTEQKKVAVVQEAEVVTSEW